jgi:flagellar motor switch/type III secretory pathway protein FliN
LLRAGRADLRITGFGQIRNNAVPGEGTIVALFGGGDGRGQRMVLVLSDDLVRDLVDTTLGRPRGSVERRLTSGEEGALLFALDRAGGDWMDLGGGGFRIKGILADSMQIAEYLQGPPKWWVRAVLETESAAGEAWLMLGDPARFGGVSPRRARIDRALDWPVEFKIIVGTSAVPAAELKRIDTGDVLVLDWSAFGVRGCDTDVAQLECGHVKRFARLLDHGRLELVSTGDLRGSMNDTENVELKGRLSQPSDDEARSMNVVVQVEVGRVTMTVDQAINLVPGRMIRLDRDVGPKVSLRAGEKLIATGELVDHEGRLAVEVTEVT